MDHTTAIVWFRRDLRLRDNPALHYAVKHAKTVVPVFVFAPDEEGDWAPGAASRWWLHHSLAALRDALAKRGSELVIRRGPTEAALRDLIRDTQASLLTYNRLFEPAVIERDRAIEKALGEQASLTSFNSNLLFEPGTIRNGQDQPYRVFTAFWRRAQQQLNTMDASLPAPRQLRAPAQRPASISLDSLELLPRIHWDAGFYKRWQPGESFASQSLRTFDDTVDGYGDSRNRPDISGTSSLSPRLHFGEISPRVVFEHLRDNDKDGADTFRREIGWREFAHHLLHAFPQTPTLPLDRRFERMPWSRRSSLLRAWQRGATGYPIVDAGMRELWHDGWMHNRVRMIAASFLTKNLQHHWLEGARWFWDTLVDADLANNTLGWQWVAGCGADAAPYYRIFNPILQAERFDPQREYIRRWIPELAALPDRWIHQPWVAPAKVLASANVRLGRSYPRPVVELLRSRNEALRAYDRIQPAS